MFVRHVWAKVPGDFHTGRERLTGHFFRYLTKQNPSKHTGGKKKTKIEVSLLFSRKDSNHPTISQHVPVIGHDNNQTPEWLTFEESIIETSNHLGKLGHFRQFFGCKKWIQHGVLFWLLVFPVEVDASNLQETAPPPTFLGKTEHISLGYWNI